MMPGYFKELITCRSSKTLSPTSETQRLLMEIVQVSRTYTSTQTNLQDSTTEVICYLNAHQMISTEITLFSQPNDDPMYININSNHHPAFNSKLQNQSARNFGDSINSYNLNFMKI